jgi:hypothetical protein
MKVIIVGATGINVPDLAYNRDRGPVLIPGFRRHVEF